MVISKITAGLKKTRDNLSSAFKSIFQASLTDDIYEEVEELLIQTDMGMDTVTTLVANVEKQMSRKEKQNSSMVFDSLRQELISMINTHDTAIRKAPAGFPTVVFVVGVNGTGKTTSVAKLANRLLADKKKVVLAACDTFRGAAIEQLEVWAQRTGTYLVKHQHGADAAAVAFDAVESAKARGADYLLVDTAGRLHTNKNLMEELKKIKRTVEKRIPSAPHEILITIDAVTGQNAVPQVKTFHEALNLTGIILTKLDGTAKGGIVVRIQHELNIPVKFIGIGESMDDLLPFDSKEFVHALFEA